jgi:hypothetical protein
VQRYTFSFESTINYEILIQITLPFQTFVVLLALVMDKEAFEKHKAFAGPTKRQHRGYILRMTDDSFKKASAGEKMD